MPLTIREYLERGPATSKEMQFATGLSQTAVSRQLRNMSDSVISVREGRAIQYALFKLGEQAMLCGCRENLCLYLMLIILCLLNV
uniref:ArsR family transcriptional regulator n=1 Tax=Candidatus Electrothrix sp. TaxID=2170559 RepID=UPI004057673B